MEMEQIDVLTDDNVCPFCDAEFLDVDDLQLHMRQLHINEGRKDRFCKFCFLNFPDMEKYSLHIRNIHLSLLKCCKYCTRLYTETHELLQHEKKHNVTVLYPKMSCSNCDSLFQTNIDLEKHEYEKHSECEDGLMLQKCFPFLSSLVNMNIRKFFEASYSNMIYACAACDMTTLDVEVYINHLIAKKCQTLCCDICFNVYRLKSKLKAHLLKHSHSYKVESSFKPMKECHKCGEKVNNTSFKLHVKQCCGMRCCNITFNSIYEYTDHVSEHSKKLLPLEVCTYCQRQMVGAEALAKHVERAHKHEIHLYKYHCIYCDQIFKHPKFLFSHFFSKHKDLRPYTCKICNEKFRIRKNFTLHIKLDHNSVGFVEFDDNFHVFFTDKKSIKNEVCQNLLESSIKPDDDSTKYAEGPESLNEDNKQEELKCESDTVENSAEVCLKDTSTTTNHENLDEENHKVSDLKMETPINKLKHSDEVTITGVESELDKNYFKEGNNSTEKKHNQKLKNGQRQSYKRTKLEVKKIGNTDDSSDDSDTPLLNVLQKKSKQQQTRKRMSKTPWNKALRSPKGQLKIKNKFICAKCNRNCYTYQNFHRHMALHTKNEFKTCIKCYEKFRSTSELNEHIKNKHSSSKLTETLKKLLEKRKSNPQINDDMEENIPSVPRELTKAEKILKTFKKVAVEASKSKVTITEVDTKKTSVKNYIETFTPEVSEAKLTMVPNSLPGLNNVKQSPVIKMLKFTPETIPTGPPKLQMPVKFNDDVTEEYKVSIRLLQDSDNTVSIFEDQFKINDVYDDTFDNNTFDNSDAETTEKAPVIPDVAEEVMLEGTDKSSKVVHSMDLQNVLLHGFRIGHLSPQAPYYKIVKIKNLLDENGHLVTINSEEQNEEVPEDITLPSGKRLVSVNPLAHLLDKNAINKVMKATKSKSNSYKPKPKNITEAIAKAMEKLNQTRAQRKTYRKINKMKK